MTRHQPQHQAKQPTQQTSAAKSSLGIAAWTRPLLMLGGAWVVVMIVALTAVSGLLSPDSSNGTHSTGATIASKTAEPAQSAKHQNRLPLWLFGAIALSCAAGCILISKQAARPARPRTHPYRKTKPRHLAPAPAPVAPASLEPSLQSPLQPPTPTMPSFALSSRHPQTAEVASSTAPTLMQLAQMQLAEASPAVGPPTVVPVTVVPAEAKTPLDWGEASLADRLDLRKPRSISSWL